MKKYNALCLFGLVVLISVFPVYGASNTPSRTYTEMSVGAVLSDLQINDLSGEKLVHRENGFSARALFYPLRWLAVGVEGTEFEREHFAGQNTYRDKRYGVLSKWVLTPDVSPSLYVLVGVGKYQRRVSWYHTWAERSRTTYMQVGLGADIPLYRHLFLSLEGQMFYHTHHEVGHLLTLNHRWEELISLRLGLRF